MSTTTIPPQTGFSRRVSFNNLNPDYIDGELAGAGFGGSFGGSYGGSYGGNDNGGSGVKFHNVNNGYGGGLMNDISKLYGGSGYGEYGSQYTTRKKHRLPDAPAKSILKNKLTPGQAMHNMESGGTLGINYHGDLNEMAREGELAVYDSSDDDETQGPMGPMRRKSYSGMSDEELMALDPQYSTTKSKVSNMEQFRFDSQKTYYLPSRKASTNPNYPQRPMYPTSNENNYKSINLTVKHQDYDQAALGRTLLTVISGRKHTWNALDWMLLTGNRLDTPFVGDGDYLVVTSFISSKFFKESDKKKHSVDDQLVNKCENLLNYIATQLPQELKVKITVEFISDVAADNESQPKPKSGYKYMLSHIYRQYHPTLIVIGNKSTNLNFKYPLRMKRNSDGRSTSISSNLSRNSIPNEFKRNSVTPVPSSYQRRGPDEYMIKFSSYIIKYSSVPVILVGNSTKFHQAPKNASRKSSSVSIYTSSDESIASDPKSYMGERLSEGDINLRSDVNSLLYSDAPDRFLLMLMQVSDKSLIELNTFLEALKKRDLNTSLLKFDDSVVFNNKMQSIYNSQIQNQNNNQLHPKDKIYKVKSMISYDEDEERKNEKIRSDKKVEKVKSSSSAKSTSPSIKSENESTNTTNDNTVKKKKSIWKKLGLKK